MKLHPGNQLELLGNPASEANGRQDRPWLVIELDHRAWMRFLSEEWLFPDDAGRVLLGLGHACGSRVAPDLMAVGVWFDQAKLPTTSVMVWRGESWMAVPLGDLAQSDTVISWEGPLPLFAVDHFTVDTSQTRAHLLAMARNFADIEPPSQAVVVAPINKVAVPGGSTPSTSTKGPPKKWDAFRGAASMALWSVPAIGPWLQLLCESLTSENPIESAEVVHAPWLRSALWSAEARSSERHPPLWHAMLDEFSRPGALKEWKPRLLLDSICSRARVMGGNEEQLDRLIDSTMLLLQDRGTIENLGLKDDMLGLVFQLVLLRPSPERFARWKEDWPAMPPSAWWTGAMLTGYLSGFRALPLSMRGSFSARKFLALRTWEVARDGGATEWNSLCQGSMDWAVEDDSIVIRAGREVLAEHKFSNRGRWYQADKNKPTYQAEATALAQQFCPDQLRQTLVLEEGDFKLLGNGRAKFDVARMMLRVNGRLEIPLGVNVHIASKLDVDGFRDWLATAAMPHRLPRPTASIDAVQVARASADAPAPVLVKDPKKKPSPKDAPKRAHLSPVNPPQGLTIVPEFISQEEESSLLEAIDNLPWDSTMSRRVQHYGWRYDYKAKKVNPAAYLGSLPSWAELLGEKLLKQGLLLELPDQVIVNEYKGSQSISKHIDCPLCFRGAIISISLNESWEMVFSRRTESGDDEKYKVLLPRRSAVVLDGEARSSWQHEIPRRINEAGLPRGRRVSITFRKVDMKR